MDFITILMVLGEALSVVLITLALGLAFTVWRDSKNPIDLGTFFLYLSAAVAIIYTGVQASLINLGLLDSSYFIKVGLLDLGDLMTVFIASFYLWFIIFLFGWSKLYSLPLVVGFYFAAYGITTGEVDPIFSYVTYAILPSMVILMINSIKNKHGLSFTLAIMAVAVVLIAVVNPATIWAFLIKWFTGINIILGSNGWWDDHVFYDRDKRKKIQNVWIARMTTVKN
jgi:hypothetical protein